jgi:ribosomal protein L7/L12
MNTPIPDDKLDSIRKDIFRGMKLQAIKTYRDCTGLGWRKCKDAVERLAVELRASDPEKFIDAIARQSVAIPDDKLESMREDIFRGMKLQAIKTYRDCTGLGLKECKDFVDSLVVELKATSPEKFIPQTLGGQIVARLVVGCSCLAFIVMVWGIAFLILHAVR